HTTLSVDRAPKERAAAVRRATSSFGGRAHWWRCLPSKIRPDALFPGRADLLVFATELGLARQRLTSLFPGLTGEADRDQDGAGCQGQEQPPQAAHDYQVNAQANEDPSKRDRDHGRNHVAPGHSLERGQACLGDRIMLGEETIDIMSDP